MTRCLQVSCFNSTTVQLILKQAQKDCQRLQFQFHNGTINTIPHSARKRVRRRSFNSTTVQLIQGGGSSLISGAMFQFHNGTINTLTNTQKKQLKMSELANNKYAFYMINYVDG